MVEPIEMPFGLRTRVGPKNYVFDWSPDPLMEGAICREGRPINCKVSGRSAVNPNQMPFGLE